MKPKILRRLGITALWVRHEPNKINWVWGCNFAFIYKSWLKLRQTKASVKQASLKSKSLFYQIKGFFSQRSNYQEARLDCVIPIRRQRPRVHRPLYRIGLTQDWLPIRWSVFLIEENCKYEFFDRTSDLDVATWIYSALRRLDFKFRLTFCSVNKRL